MKKIIKKIPFVGKIAMSIKRKMASKKSFKTSGKYWIDRYKKGDNSGAGSYNKLAEFKGEVINSFVKKNKIKTIIEFGCGDGNQLRYFNFQSYLGYDISPEILQICLKLFNNDHTKKFKLLSDYRKEAVDLTLSLDVIYHLIEDEIFNDYMRKLFESSNSYVIIYSSNNENNQGNAPHVRNRKFTTWIKRNKPEFQLVKHIPNKYPYTGEEKSSSIADFYIFQML